MSDQQSRFSEKFSLSNQGKIQRQSRPGNRSTTFLLTLLITNTILSLPGRHKGQFEKAKKVVCLVSTIAEEAKEIHKSRQNIDAIANVRHPPSKQETKDQENESQRRVAWARSMSDSGFESKESEGAKGRPGRRSRSATSRRFSVDSALRQSSDKKFRNFTNVFGKKTEKRVGVAKYEKVTLQSIMKSNWSNIPVSGDW